MAQWLFFAIFWSSSFAAHVVQNRTTVTKPGDKITADVQLDDQQILHYDDVTEKMIPDTGWMKKVCDDTDQCEVTQDMKIEHEDLPLLLKKIMKYSKQTGGNHKLTTIFGCELQYEESVGRGFGNITYNEVVFLTLNLITITWIPAPEAQDFLKEWRTAGSEAKYWKKKLETDCITSLKLYMNHKPAGADKQTDKRSPDSPPTHSSDTVWITPCTIVLVLVVTAVVLLVIYKKRLIQCCSGTVVQMSDEEVKNMSAEMNETY